jgi:hypothetical protein
MTRIAITTRTSPSRYDTSRIYVIGDDGIGSHESIEGHGSQGMSPLIFPESEFRRASYIGFKGQELKIPLRFALISSSVDLSLDDLTPMVGTATVIDPVVFPGGVKTVQDQLLWLMEYVWAPGMDRQSWIYIEDTGVYDRTNNAALITGANQVDPCVVFSPLHGLANGDVVLIQGVEGMTELNDRWYIVSAATPNTIALLDLDSNTIDATGYAAWTAGGTVGTSPPGLPCVIESVRHRMSPRFSIDRKMDFELNLVAGGNLI